MNDEVLTELILTDPLFQTNLTGFSECCSLIYKI